MTGIKRIFVTVILMAFTLLFARSFRVGEIPNGNVNRCANCHVNPAGGGPRNAFGQTVEQNFLDGNGHVIWGKDLASLDSDGDGFSNGHELQDPFGLWSTGKSAPGNSAFVSIPGDASSTPSGDGQLFSLDLHLTQMDPHLGQKVVVGVIETSVNILVSTVEIASLSIADTHIVLLNILEWGKPYQIDFFADLNQNGIYDAPPADHAWRLMTGIVRDNIAIDFAHNTDFTDISGPLAIENQENLAHQFYMEPNYPNPFNPITTIRFYLPVSVSGSVEIFNLKGQRIKTFVEGVLESGIHQYVWDGTDDTGKKVSSGVYIAVMKSKTIILKQKMVLTK